MDAQDFKPVPAVYQIELTNRCNLKCPMCLRTTDMVRGTDLLDIGLLELMVARGEFNGTSYVELQLAGEPTLHPHLGDIIDYLHTRAFVRVGLSTHGLLIGKRPGVLDALLKLDNLTISVDSVDPAVYAQMRYPAKFSQLEEALDTLFAAYGDRATPVVDLQLVRTPLVAGSGDAPALQAMIDRKGWPAAVRVTHDCFIEMQGREGHTSRRNDLCVNPWLTVSVTHTGDVLSCCYIFDPDPDSLNYYGNLYVQSLAEIWSGPRVQAMRAMHRSGDLQGACAKCYQPSPALIHHNIQTRATQRIAGRVHLPVY